MQHLHRYGTEIDGLKNEILEMFSDEDISQLSSLLKAANLESWGIWKSKYARVICDYIRATPKERSHKAEWKQPNTRLFLMYASVQELDNARAIFDTVSDPVFLPGCRYREMASYGAAAYDALQDYQCELWPFDSDDENPFLDD